METKIAGNFYDKYHTKNPLYKFAVKTYLTTLEKVVFSIADARTILEVGCGDGYILNRISAIRNFERVEGIDLSERIIDEAKNAYPRLNFSVGSCYNLRFKTDEFDIVLACEVLEHLEDCDKAVSEISRVAKKFCIVSVPLEPLWRICNLVRGAYITRGGNTPGHLRHLGKRSFAKLLSRYFKIEALYYPLPWQLAVCKKLP